jgi:hypothetical protein
MFRDLSYFLTNSLINQKVRVNRLILIDQNVSLFKGALTIPMNRSIPRISCYIRKIPDIMNEVLLFRVHLDIIEYFLDVT